MEPATLFIANLPPSVTEEAVTDLFKDYEGFESSRLRVDRNGCLVGFVEFSDAVLAGRARDSMQGFKIGKEPTAVAIEFAHGGPTRHRKRDRSEMDEAKYPSSLRQGPVPRLNAAMTSPSFGDSPSRGHSSHHDYFGRGMHTLAASPADMFGMFGAMMPPYMSSNSSMGLIPPLPADASSCLYVEAVPSDATEREMAHIFRPYQGFQSLRLVRKESRSSSGHSFVLCFVEFDNKLQAMIAMNSLQGYRMDPTDTRGLSIDFSKKKVRGRDREERYQSHTQSHSRSRSRSRSHSPSRHRGRANTNWEGDYASTSMDSPKEDEQHQDKERHADKPAQ